MESAADYSQIPSTSLFTPRNIHVHLNKKVFKPLNKAPKQLPILKPKRKTPLAVSHEDLDYQFEDSGSKESRENIF